MDLGTLLGVVAGVALYVWAIGQGGSLLNFVDLPSVAITLGGTVAATLINYPLGRLVGVLRVAKNAFVSRPIDPNQTIATLTEFAEKARREGLLALEESVDQLEDEFLRKGLQLVVDGTDPELVRNILETELAFLEERHRAGAAIFDTMGTLAPAFGLIGTLIGLVNMLRHIDDPKAIGPGLAVALLTTFYGAMLANFLFIPIAGKLRVKSAEEILNREVMIEGILSIQAGDNPRIVEQKLRSFLAPSERRDRAGAQAHARAQSEEEAWR